MTDYIFKPESIFLNTIAFGSDAGNSFASPELRQIIAANQTRDAVRQLGQVQLAALHGQRETNDRLAELNVGMQEMGDQVAGGLDYVGSQVGELSDNMQVGFGQLGMGLQTGFESVVKSLYHVDERLGQRLMVGFTSIGQQMERQHGQLVGTLVQGFDFLADVTTQAADRTVTAILNAAEMQVEATTAAADQITNAIVQTGKLQTEALVALEKRLVEMTTLMQHPDAVRALEHFMVGMNFLNNVDFSRAREQFKKSRDVYAGHFPTLFAEGFCCRVLEDDKTAEGVFQAALSQTDSDPEQSRRQKSVAALYLGRISFDRKDYGQARRWFHDAYRSDKSSRNALVEGAACLFLDRSRNNSAADAQAVKQEFNSQGTDAYLYWYLLALTLAADSSDIAKEAFRHGRSGDHRIREQNREELIALLWRLNPRTAGSLLEIVADDIPWL